MDEEPTAWRPSWWDWPLLTSGHLLDRMVDRRFSEVDLREMLEDVNDLRAGAGEGRWVAECRWRGEDRVVVLEPDESSRRTIVVTAYRIHWTMEAPLEVTYRHGRPFAAHYRLPRREGDQVECSRPYEAGLVVDLAADGRPLGIEITEPRLADVTTFNRLLISLGFEPVDASVLAPLCAA